MRSFLLLTLAASAASAQPGLDEGAALFAAGQPAEALAAFDAAAPGLGSYPPLHLWRGLARYAAAGAPATSFDDAYWTAQSELHQANTADAIWGTATTFLKGLLYWRTGDTASAQSWFEGCKPGAIGGAACARAIADVQAGLPAPPLAEWPALAELPGRPGAPPPADPLAAPPGADGPPTPAAGVGFPRFARGHRVLVNTSGPLWAAGVVHEVGQDGTHSEGMYLVEGEGVYRGWYWHGDVAAPEREPSWTDHYLGTWDVRVPVSMTTRTEGNERTTTVTGGMRLPPLRVSPDGTYTWVTDGGVIEGTWVPRADAPGVILLAGEGGVDWTLYPNSDRSSTEVFGTDLIILNTPTRTYYDAYRTGG